MCKFTKLLGVYLKLTGMFSTKTEIEMLINHYHESEKILT